MGPRSAGPATDRVAASVRQLRMSEALSTYELSRRLKAIGRTISATSITRLEQGDRRVDADDLLALGVVLNCSPNRLLMPPVTDQAESVNVTGGVQASAADAWAWACGERPLITLGGCQPSGVDEALFAVENQPHRHARLQRRAT